MHMTEKTRQNNNKEVEIDLAEICRVLLNKIWTLILVVVIAGGLAAGYTSFFMTPMYQSTSQIFILNTKVDLSLTELQLGSQLTSDYMEIIKSRPVLEATIQELGLDMDYAALSNSITISNPQNTRILYITVTNQDAYMAKTIVDKYTEVSVNYIAQIMDTEKPNVIDYGHIPEGPSSPSMKKNAILGALLGFVIAAGIIIVRYMMNDSIHSSEDVEKYLGISTIGLIPFDGAGSKKKTRGKDRTGGDGKKKSQKKKKIETKIAADDSKTSRVKRSVKGEEAVS